jgi:hypothetical protein
MVATAIAAEQMLASSLLTYIAALMMTDRQDVSPSSKVSSVLLRPYSYTVVVSVASFDVVLCRSSPALCSAAAFVSLLCVCLHAVIFAV